ncbi:arsenate reductase (thioredoxin) [Sulfobacillus harzensis]|uniref:Arsenate reductase n=1 Tax=Sulfobacillus harzensis TaxID=2729629 RepID=A0A7Y0L6H5_9FIRM|nr:arsenate reductase (thioredoxin) [Sulfobacillus harzensis]NMP23636.1 arsenate reductase (thioredoxin) [Sulfobacillus harzensis]
MRNDKPILYFLCTGNSCRSQMAEGWARHLGQERVEAYSAGLETHGLNPRAVVVMQEAGVDISDQESKLIDPDLLHRADYVITLCGDARDTCPVTPPEVTRLHWGFPDPARTEGTNAEIMAQFRHVRDGIRDRVAEFLREIVR